LDQTSQLIWHPAFGGDGNHRMTDSHWTISNPMTAEPSTSPLRAPQVWQGRDRQTESSIFMIQLGVNSFEGLFSFRQAGRD
jgi:hypothetical protein